jgi:dolichol-phosphate mannosyltransferase
MRQGGLFSRGVSVVTTTWNEADNIAQLVSAVRQVLAEVPHEVIVVDDESSDGTLEIAQRVADIAVGKKREGQTKGLLHGMRLAKYPVVVTIDADLENDPAYIPKLMQLTEEFDVAVASRTKLPRFSEKLASKTLGNLLGVKDAYSNYRAFRSEVVPRLELRHGETFGAELLISAKKMGFSSGELSYEPPPRRSRPRIGGTAKANLRILWALAKSLWIYLL